MYIPFLPLAVVDKWNTELVNTIAFNLQYIPLMMIVFSIFLIVSAFLLPFAYIKSLVFKIQQIFRAQNSSEMIKRTFVVVEFGFFGLLMMTLTFIADSIYFWINNYRVKLKKIIIDQEPNILSMSWIKKLNLLATKYAHHRIKSIYTIKFVSKFREDIDINA